MKKVGLTNTSFQRGKNVFGDKEIRMFDIRLVPIYLIILSCNLNCKSLGNKKDDSKMQQKGDELQSEGKHSDMVTVSAEIEHFTPVAIDSLGSTPEESMSIPGTYIRIVSPEKYKDKKFYVYHLDDHKDVPEQWKRKRQKLRFGLGERILLEQFQEDKQWLYASVLIELRWIDNH